MILSLLKRCQMETPTHLIKPLWVRYVSTDRPQSALSMLSFWVRECKSWGRSSKLLRKKLSMRLTASWRDTQDLNISRNTSFHVILEEGGLLDLMEEKFLSLKCPNVPISFAVVIYRPERH